MAAESWLVTAASLAKGPIVQRAWRELVQAQFHYDGDGRRVQSVVNGVTTAFVGQYFEWTGAMKKYYYFCAQRVAVR